MHYSWELADKIQPAINPLLSGEYEINNDKPKFHFKAVELKDIRDAFAKVKAAKSFGIDNISSYFMKLALPGADPDSRHRRTEDGQLSKA